MLKAFSMRRLDARAALLLIVLAAFAVRMLHVSELRMWGDEGFSVFSASRDLYAITFEGKDVDPHPPLYYYLLHFYLPLAGASELAIRFFSIFFGTATGALVYALGRRMFSARIGALAATLAALAPFLVHYSQEVRMYALVIFLGALALYAFLKLLEKESRARWIFFAVTMFLAQYTLYQAAFLWVAQGIFLLPFLRRRFAFVARWLAVALGVVLLFLPWLLTHSASAAADVRDVAGDVTLMSLPTFFARGFAAISAGVTIPVAAALWIAALYAGLIALALFLLARAGAANARDWLLIAAIVLPILALYPVYYLLPLYRGRLFALACIPFVLLLARSTDALLARARVVAIPLALIVGAASAYALNDYFFRYSRYNAAVDDYIPAIQAIETRAQAGDLILLNAYWQQGYFISHYRGAPLEFRDLSQQPHLDAAVARARNVWAIVQNLGEHPAETFLARNAFPIDEQDYGAMRVLAYRAGAPGRAEQFPTPILYDNGLALVGYRLNDAPIEAGTGAATIELEWQATHVIAADFTLSVRLTDARGEKILAQVDRLLQNESLPTSRWATNQTVRERQGLSVAGDVAPGDYAFQIVLYNFQDRRVANILAPANLRGPSLELGRVAIIPRTKTK